MRFPILSFALNQKVFSPSPPSVITPEGTVHFQLPAPGVMDSVYSPVCVLLHRIDLAPIPFVSETVPVISAVAANTFPGSFTVIAGAAVSLTT